MPNCGEVNSPDHNGAVIVHDDLTKRTTSTHAVSVYVRQLVSSWSDGDEECRVKFID